MLRAIGAVNESMGGASIAAPLDSAGAIYQNPASIAALKDNEISFGLGIIIPHSQAASEVVGLPETYGKAYTEAGEIPAPTMATVFRSKEKSRWTFGVAIAGVGGAAALYEAPNPAYVQTQLGPMPVNPILEGKAKASNVQVFEIMPTASYNVTDKLAVGFTPVLGLASLSLNPMPFDMPVQQGMHNYGTRYTWAGGFNLGAYYDFKNNWRTGFTFKSPLWADALHFTGTDPNTGEQVARDFQFNLPMILGWGVSYTGFRKTVVALDVRYFDYENTEGFGNVIDAQGNISGLGWNSVLSVAVGVERQIGEKAKIRAGYCWNENPIPAESQFANVSAPLFMQNVVSLGATYTFLPDFDVMFAWSHAFQTSGTGMNPTGMVKVTNSVSADSLLLGLTKRF